MMYVPTIAPDRHDWRSPRSDSGGQVSDLDSKCPSHVLARPRSPLGQGTPQLTLRVVGSLCSPAHDGLAAICASGRTAPRFPESWNIGDVVFDGQLANIGYLDCVVRTSEPALGQFFKVRNTLHKYFVRCARGTIRDMASNRPNRRRISHRRGSTKHRTKGVWGSCHQQRADKRTLTWITSPNMTATGPNRKI